MAELEIEGMEALIKALGEVEDLPRLLRPAVDDVLKMVQERAREYPPPRGTYQRTGRLAASWNTVPTAQSETMLGKVVSRGGIASYNRYVQSAADQAWMHKGRWQTDEDIALEKQEQAARILGDFLAQELLKI